MLIVVIQVMFIFLLPETSGSNILYRRTQRLRKLTGIQTLKCQSEIEVEEMTGKEVRMEHRPLIKAIIPALSDCANVSQVLLMILVRPITLNFKEPIILALNVWIALVYGVLYIWFESFPIVFIGIYHFNLGQEGLAFVGILVGAMVVVPPFFYYVYKYIEPQVNERGELKPEKRIPPAFVGAFCIPICLFWFGWSAKPDVHWIMPIIGSAWFAVGTYLLFQTILGYLVDAYPDYVASVLAGNDLMRSSFGAGFPLFASGMYHNLGVGWASSLLGFLSLLFIPIPFVLYKVCPSPPFFRHTTTLRTDSLCLFDSTEKLSGNTANTHDKTFKEKLDVYRTS